MLTPSEFVQKSLDLNLFFLRIMKEHSLFLEASFVAKNMDLAKRAEEFKNRFNQLLAEAVALSNGNVSRDVLASGEVVTDKTLAAERKTEELSGIKIDTELTARELQLRPGQGNPTLENKVYQLNSKIIQTTKDLVEFKTLVLQEQLRCSIFTFNFPLLIEHIRREAVFYIDHLNKLQRKTAIDPSREIIQEKVFWDRIMAEHSMFIAHLLDPSEKKLIQQADDFARVFSRLEQRAAYLEKRGPNGRALRQLINIELKATKAIQEFKDTGDRLVLACKIRSIIIPLLADHVLREADHFLRILKQANLSS